MTFKVFVNPTGPISQVRTGYVLVETFEQGFAHIAEVTNSDINGSDTDWNELSFIDGAYEVHQFDHISGAQAMFRIK